MPPGVAHQSTQALWDYVKVRVWHILRGAKKLLSLTPSVLQGLETDILFEQLRGLHSDLIILSLLNRAYNIFNGHIDPLCSYTVLFKQEKLVTLTPHKCTCYVLYNIRFLGGICSLGYRCRLMMGCICSPLGLASFRATACFTGAIYFLPV